MWIHRNCTRWRCTSEVAELMLAPSDRPSLRYMLAGRPGGGVGVGVVGYKRAIAALSWASHVTNQPCLEREREERGTVAVTELNVSQPGKRLKRDNVKACVIFPCKSVCSSNVNACVFFFM